MFQVLHSQVHGQEPAEAQELWKNRFVDIDLDPVTLVVDSDAWERRREGQPVCRSEGTYSEQKSLATSLYGRELRRLIGLLDR